MKHRLLAGASLALAAISLGWQCDYSQACNGHGNNPKDCAAVLLGGSPKNVTGGRGLHRPNIPDPTASQRQACIDAAEIIYGDDTAPLWFAIEGCQLEEHWDTFRCPTWSQDTERFIKLC